MNQHAIYPKIRPYLSEMIELRRHFHQYPELSMQEYQTSDKIAELLTHWGIEVTRGIANTGLVGVLKKGNSHQCIGLRADMDALPITETTGKSYASKNAGVMHACGHDGHMAMLLTAAKYLAHDGQFDGTVVFIFQPDEEVNAGAKVMIDEGLFQRFPVDQVFAMHNYPTAPVGQLMVCKGPVMAGTVSIEITITGVGAHAAHPNLGIDPVVVSAHIITAIQSIASRNLDPLEAGVITIASIHAGKAHNVIPQSVEMTGTMRYFDDKVRERMKTRLNSIVQQTAAAFGATASIRLIDGYIPTINHDSPTDLCYDVACQLTGKENVVTDKLPSMGAEDFAYMLAARPGTYLFIGNGPGEGGCMLHNPAFDFNDDNILVGGAYWSALVEHALKPL